MSDGNILALDQGTHSTRAIVFDARGQQLAVAQQAVTLDRLSRAEIEQSPEELLDSARTVVRRVLADPAVEPGSLIAAGIATQRSSVVAWDRGSGEALAPVLSWQDRRAQAFIDTLAADEQKVRTITGLRLSPHYGGGKMRWLLQRSRRVREAHAADRLLMGPLASYLLFHLLDGRPALVDHANASRTLLCNLETRDWDLGMLSLFEVPRETLPACCPIEGAWGQLAGLDVPLRAVNGDQTAALYAQGDPPPGSLVVNVGTGAFVLMPTDDPVARHAGLLAGIARSGRGAARYYIEGTVNGAGAALAWVADQFGADGWQDLLPGWLESIPEPTLFINTVGGLGAPWWQAGPAPYFVKPDVGAAEALVAAVESIVFLLQANIECLRGIDPALDRIQVSGGLARLDGLCQRLADLSGLDVYRTRQVEAAARGVAWLATGGPAAWTPARLDRRFVPRDERRLRQRYQHFKDLLATFER